MLKLLLGRLLPLGATAFLLKSSFSPIKPALAAFGAATDALAGQSTAQVDANFPGADGSSPQVQVPTAGSVRGALGSLFGDGQSEQAKAELDRVIADVKYHGHPPEPVPQPAKPKPPARAKAKPHPAKKKGAEVDLTGLEHRR